MSRRKTVTYRAQMIALNRERRHKDYLAPELADHVLRCVDAHASGSHKLALELVDDEQILECVSCGIPVVSGSEDVMEIVIAYVHGCGIEIEMV